MEKIRWVHTPVCRRCQGAFLREHPRNPPCLGCPRAAAAAAEQETDAQNRQIFAQGRGLSGPRRWIPEKTKRTVRKMRDEGRSYGEIALRLGIPRSTAAGAARQRRVVCFPSAGSDEGQTQKKLCANAEK